MQSPDVFQRTDTITPLERLAAVETHMRHMATKAWVLAGVVGGMVSAAIVTIAIMRLFV